MLKTLKSKIALVAVAGLGFGLVSTVPAFAVAYTSATAATVSPVRVTKSDGTNLDKVPYAAVTLTQSGADFAFTANDDVTVTLTSAPSAAAKLAVVGTQAATTVGASFTEVANTLEVATLGTPAPVTTGTAAAATGVVTFFVAADAAGRYIGTIRYTDASGDTLDTTFDFTTTGVPASVSLSATTATSSVGGNTTVTVTAKDSAARTTQLGVFDTIAVTDGTSTGSADNVSISDVEIFDGTADVIYTAPATASTASTVTFTPGGTLAGLTAATATITTDSTVVDNTAVPAQGAAPAAAGNNTSFAVTSPANVTDADGDGDVDNSDITAAIPVGTSSVTVTVLMAANATTYRFKGVASAGTLNGGTSATAYVNATTPATGTRTATVTFTLDGNALLAGATLTISQVDVVNADVAGLTAVLTQTAPSLAAAGITQSPSGSIIAKLGATTAITVTVKDQFSRALGAGHTVRLLRGATVAGGTVIGSAVTAADGTAVVNATNASTLASGSSEQYSVQVVPTIGAAVADDAVVTITYSTDGVITGLSVAITGSTGGTTPLVAAVGTTAATDQTIYPALLVPSDGFADDVAGDQVYTVSTAAVTGTAGATAEVVTLTTTATPANSVSYSGSEGVKFLTTAPTASTTLWSAGAATATVANATAIYVYGTKTGVGTVTITSGGLTRTVSIWFYNQATDFYSISLASATSKIDGGAYATIVATVKDVFGNVVDTAAGDLAVAAEGAILLGGMQSSTTTGTGAAGTATITYLGNVAGGTGKVTVTNGVTTNAWATGYTAPTGAAAPVRSAVLDVTVAAGTTAANPALDAVKSDVKAVSDTVATLSKAVTTIQSSVTELTTSFTAQIKSLSSA
ncbi:MAG: hypothetical protein RLZZ07_118, partial [Actinomycetota bacterium]